MKLIGLAGLMTAFTAVLVAQSTALRFDAPKAWMPVKTASAMRVAQYSLARAPGDAEDAELVVYYFGGQGGSVDANLNRWLSQIEQPDGRPSKAVATTSALTVNGLKVTVLDVSGKYVAEMMPGSPVRHDKPGFRMKAAVVETPSGPYFVKLTGPARTVQHWDASFIAFLKSMRM